MAIATPSRTNGTCSAAHRRLSSARVLASTTFRRESNSPSSSAVPRASGLEGAWTPVARRRCSARVDGERGSWQPATAREPWDGPNMEGP